MVPTFRHEDKARAARLDHALHLCSEARREECFVESSGEGEVERAVEEREVVRIGAADERWRFEDLDAGDFVDAEAVERVDLVAGAGGDAEDVGVVVEEWEVAEEDGEGVDLDLPEARGVNAQVALLGGDVEARGEVAGGLGEAEVRLDRRAAGDAGVGRAEEEEEERQGGYCDRGAR